MANFSRRQVVRALGCGVAGALLAPAGLAVAAGTIPIDDKSVLIVVDVQNCFLPGGSLEVKDGDRIVPIINRIAKKFAHVVLTQDWHTPGHVSFASAHPGKAAFEVISLPYGDQVLWPDHCVQGTPGANISKDIAIPTRRAQGLQQERGQLFGLPRGGQKNCDRPCRLPAGSAA
jgi:nicotinamidase/pyrazinamidase